MRSKAHHRKGHPIHPMLVPFPIAFIIGAFAADVAGLALDQPLLWATGWYLAIAGVVMGLLAGVPGFVDWHYTVPPNSSGKERATKHMIVNVSSLVLVALAWWLRGDPAVPPDWPIVALELLGAGIITYGGWLGSTLVYRNQIGVDHRYARAGKWKDETIELRVGSIPVAKSDELEMDQMKLLRVGEKRIVLARTEDGYVAFSDHCTHKGGSLAGGTMTCRIVMCPWHGSQFDVRTGEVRAGPAEDSIRTYPVEEADGEVRLLLDREAVETGPDERRNA